MCALSSPPSRRRSTPDRFSTPSKPASFDDCFRDDSSGYRSVMLLHGAIEAMLRFSLNCVYSRRSDSRGPTVGRCCHPPNHVGRGGADRIASESLALPTDGRSDVSAASPRSRLGITRRHYTVLRGTQRPAERRLTLFNHTAPLDTSVMSVAVDAALPFTTACANAAESAICGHGVPCYRAHI